MACDADGAGMAWSKWREKMGICQDWSGYGVWKTKRMVEGENGGRIMASFSNKDRETADPSSSYRDIWNKSFVADAGEAAAED